MDHHNRFEDALRQSDRGQALRALALELAAEGNDRQQVYDLFERYLLARRQTGFTNDGDEDLLLDTMDALTGWCHPDRQLLKDS
jgi:hypothetical protein